jgi:glycerol-3-phosphate dehydrogenase (NAD(P)+)
VRVSATRDVVGVEVAGALSNVGHIAAGLAAGAGFGETEQSLLHVRALLEATRIGVFMGAERATFTGLAGLGDLIPRNVTSTRLHRKAGEDFVRAGVRSNQDFAASAKDREDDAANADARDVFAMEGLVTARAMARFAERNGLDLPLVVAVDQIFAKRQQVRPALDHVLSLDLGLQAA